MYWYQPTRSDNFLENKMISSKGLDTLLYKVDKEDDHLSISAVNL